MTMAESRDDSIMGGNTQGTWAPDNLQGSQACAFLDEFACSRPSGFSSPTKLVSGDQSGTAHFMVPLWPSILCAQTLPQALTFPSQSLPIEPRPVIRPARTMSGPKVGEPLSDSESPIRGFAESTPRMIPRPTDLVSSDFFGRTFQGASFQQPPDGIQSFEHESEYLAYDSVCPQSFHESGQEVMSVLARESQSAAVAAHHQPKVKILPQRNQFGFACTTCGRFSTKYAAVSAHVQTKHLKSQRFKCVECKRTYGFAALTKHGSKCHQHMCPVCRTHCHSVNDLQVHTRVHSTEARAANYILSLKPL